MRRTPDRRRPSTTIVLAIALAGCASAEPIRVLNGQSGPVTWEATDIRQTSEERGTRLRWDYTLVLRNTGSSAIAFEHVSTGIVVPGESWGGQSRRPFSHRVPAGGTLTIPNSSYSHGCRDCDPGYVAIVFRQGVTRILEFEGRDDRGDPVKVTVRIPFSNAVGATVP